MCCFLVAENSSSHVLHDKVKLVFIFLNKMYHDYGKRKQKWQPIKESSLKLCILQAHVLVQNNVFGLFI